ncbi:MAG: type II toxin-antitoxin system Phd/YefM family antitoxin [Pseudomonadota bacterium]
MERMILTERMASISAFRQHPLRVMAAADGLSVAILRHGEPVFYCVPARLYEAMISQIEDVELNALADKRQGQAVIDVDFDLL